jgi:hypothetical protein
MRLLLTSVTASLELEAAEPKAPESKSICGAQRVADFLRPPLADKEHGIWDEFTIGVVTFAYLAVPQ